jgi:hypothetical protein
MATDVAARELSREVHESDHAAKVAVGRPALGSAKAAAKERNGGIDALRAAVTLLVAERVTCMATATAKNGKGRPSFSVDNAGKSANQRS